MILERSLPEAQGVSSKAIMSFLTKIKEENQELHSFMLLKNGKVISECWWKPYAPQYRHQLFSLSKSFTSTAIGMAIDEKLLTVDTLLSEIFPDEIKSLDKDMDEKMNRMTVKHLLTMSTGMEYENWKWDDKLSSNLKGFLSSHIKNEPGSVFFYHTLATYVQSAIITKLTGQKLIEYLKPRLFEPLGIDPTWEEDNKGISFGGFGLNLKTEEIATFGQFLLQKGNWQGKQLVSSQWIDDATSKQISNGDDPDNDWAQGYGYQFWRCKPDSVYRGDGMYGQFCIVMPNENSVIAITSNSDMAKVQNIIWDTLLPALKGTDTPIEAVNENNELVSYTSAQSHLTACSTDEPYKRLCASYKISKAANNKNAFISYDHVHINSENDECILTIDAHGFGSVGSDSDTNIRFLYFFKIGEWTYGAAQLSEKPVFSRVCTYGNWSGNKFTAYAWYYETPIKYIYELDFSDDMSQVELNIKNIGFPFEPVTLYKEPENTTFFA